MKLLQALLVTLSLATSVLGRPEPREKRWGDSKSKGGEKYFFEAGGTEALGHYDGRYFQGEVDYEAHRVALRHLIRSYVSVFRALGIETWLAHGTLLGWWWNGQIMPWDYDLDVQVTASTLQYLGDHYNRTMHEYRYVDESTGEEMTKVFLLDVNPNHVERVRGNGMNVIDARWIDTSNGMFIDITGLAERDPKRAPGVWACKNNHRYKTTELYPMRETEFEGVPATVPYAFDTVLMSEYGKKITNGILKSRNGYSRGLDKTEAARSASSKHRFRRVPRPKLRRKVARGVMLQRDFLAVLSTGTMMRCHRKRQFEQFVYSAWRRRFGVLLYGMQYCIWRNENFMTDVELDLAFA
ncbi:mannosylphosphate transferase [Diaporthe amygdali]|uniref:mannosylphosphate transferase n=1 Tax=Phomopsis amygdali TaxID=1214568 RepID=UPI0022FF3043|nr:mannosylphosphate transferase [Diaporthe amygdali]KAJ0124632.1 mannosylphosphate transferase [Diaporthe amygdali]